MIPRVIASAMAVTVAAALAASAAETTNLDLKGITALEVRTFNGAITLQVGTERPSLKSVKLGEATLSVTKRDTTLVVIAKTNKPEMPNARIDLELRVPAGLAALLATGNGNIDVRGAVKSLKVEIGNGDTRIEDTKDAAITVHSSNGSLILHGSSGHLDASSGNGRVSLESFSFTPGSHSVVRSGNGSITVLALAAPGGLRITGTSGTGRANVCAPGFEIKLESLVVGGRFSATKAGSNLATLDLSTGNGDIVVNPSLLIGNCK